MKDPESIINQCENMIKLYEEGILLCKKLRKQAIKEGRKNSRQKTVLNANGAYIRVWENKSK
tara:strand:+ start:172 stop:357 length:186 start_codon:yes stop_codon:yes gene_type:complete